MSELKVANWAGSMEGTNIVFVKDEYNRDIGKVVNREFRVEGDNNEYLLVRLTLSLDTKKVHWDHETQELVEGPKRAIRV